MQCSRCISVHILWLKEEDKYLLFKLTQSAVKPIIVICLHSSFRSGFLRKPWSQKKCITSAADHAHDAD